MQEKAIQQNRFPQSGNFLSKLNLEIADYFKYKRPLSLLWEKQGNDSLSFSSRVRGVEIAVIFEILGERVKGILTVGKSE